MQRVDDLFFREPSGGGLLILSGILRPLYVNREAAEILGYPEGPSSIKSVDSLLLKKTHSPDPKVASSGPSPFVSEFVSGKRRYTCRAFSLNPVASEDPEVEPKFALLLERPVQTSMDTMRIAQEFRLTQREVQTMQFLVQGLTSKEIASRMKISPNTVKAFIRLIMVKTGTSTRSGIVGKILPNRADNRFASLVD